MIEQSEAMSVLLGACPSFEDRWRAHLEDFGNDVLYVAAGAYARHLLKLFRDNDRSSFSTVGAAIERLIVDGSGYVRELAIVGIIEGVQNVWSANNVDPELFFPYLEREGGEAWVKLNNFWSGGSR